MGEASILRDSGSRFYRSLPEPDRRFGFCVVCGKSFKKSRGDHKYCSKRCRLRGQYVGAIKVFGNGLNLYRCFILDVSRNVVERVQVRGDSLGQAADFVRKEYEPDFGFIILPFDVRLRDYV